MQRYAKRFSPLHDLGPATPYLYLLPTAIFTVVFLVIPTLSVIWYGFHEWSGVGAMRWVGLGNYLNFTRDQILLGAISVNLLYMVFFSILPLAIGVTIAAISGRVKVPGERYFRVILLMPQVISSVAMGVIFGWIFAPIFGLVNSVLRVIGLGAFQQPWLGSHDLAPFAVGSVGTWIWMGFAVIVFTTGIQKIEEALYDAAAIDGAGPFRQFFFITLPSLAHEFVVVVIITLIRAFGSGVFGVVSAVTGSNYGTAPISLIAYRTAFVQSRMGYGSAIVVFLMIIMLGLSALAMYAGRERT